MKILYEFVTFFVVCFLKTNASDVNESKILGILPVDCQIGKPSYPSHEEVSLFVYGNKLEPGFLAGIAKYNTCDNILPIKLIVDTLSDGTVASLTFTTPPSGESYFVKVGYYLCLLPKTNDWVYQDIPNHIAFYVYEPLITQWVLLTILVISFALSCLMSGLNIGLLSLDMNELQLLKSTGTLRERKYAEKIIPVRKRGNYLLCSIVITSTMCNAISTVIIDGLIAGYLAIFASTCLIVLIGEIIPQSVCTYAPLAIGANTVYIIIAVMVLTAPVSYPLTLLLNCILGKEIVTIYTKERLKEVFKMTELANTEENIIFGTLELSKKTVLEIMTKLDDIFKLSYDAILDFETITLITNSGYSRIPIYVKNNSNLCYVLLTKELALIDPDDGIPVKIFLQNFNRNCLYIPKDYTLDMAFSMFKDSRLHMAFVVERRSTNEKDYNVIGLVTFEDVIEEIFQQEINDETDIFLDNKDKRRLTEFSGKIKIDSDMRHHSNKPIVPSESVKLATFYFLSGLSTFSAKFICPEVLHALLNLDVFYESPGIQLPRDNLYVKGKPVDYFIMVIEGLMEIRYGKQELKFEVGPFKYFGIKSLESLFIPEFTLTSIKKSVYLKITQEMYRAAILATRYLKHNEVPNVDKNSNLFLLYDKLIKFE